MSQGNKECILQLQNLSKYFGGLKACDDVNIEILEGELHCILGPNGAGKSTLFKMITGEYSPTKGRVLYRGEDFTAKEMWERAVHGISMKMQIPGVFSNLTLRENIRIALQRHTPSGTIDDEIDKLMALVGIANLGDPYVKNMPHGQQQLLEIAMTMASNPRLLLLDEPAAGMGPEETEFAADLVKRINDQGITVIFIDHDMNFVKRIANRVTVMHYGTVFAEGTLAEIEAHEGVKRIYLGDA